MTWKLVPATLTDEMVAAARGSRNSIIHDENSRTTYSAMLSASPDPTTNDALVERVAAAIWDNATVFSKPEWSALEPVERAIYRNAARAAIRAMEEKP